MTGNNLNNNKEDKKIIKFLAGVFKDFLKEIKEGDDASRPV